MTEIAETGPWLSSEELRFPEESCFSLQTCKVGGTSQEKSSEDISSYIDGHSIN